MYNTDAILTDRESQVVLGYVNGKNGKEIADKCCMAYRTVVNHTQNAFDKAGCQRSVHALVSWWYRTNFPELLQKAGVMAVIIGIMLSTQVNNPTRRTRQAIRRQRVEFVSTTAI